MFYCVECERAKEMDGDSHYLCVGSGIFVSWDMPCCSEFKPKDETKKESYLYDRMHV